MKAAQSRRIDRNVDPKLIRYLVETISKAVHPRLILLYGSRARGDHQDRSDYDIAVEGSAEENWAELLSTIAEQAPTLLKIEVLRLEEVNPQLRERICKEGFPIYESARATED